MQSLHRVEKSPPSDGTGGITAGDLSTQSIIGAVCIYLPYRHIPPLEMTVAAGTIGHTCGVRVQRGRLTALRAEGCGRLSAAGYASLHTTLRGRQRLCR